MPLPHPLVAQVECLQDILIAQATGGGASTYGEYAELRAELLKNPLTKNGLPKFVHSYRDLNQFWQFIKYEFRSYAERRNYIWEAFRPLLEALEASPGKAFQISDEETLSRLSPEAIQTVWNRALERQTSDPEGAITSARALLETACRHILEDLGTQPEDGIDLPKLYRLTSEGLGLAPSQHSEAIFKQILGGCTAVIEGLGALRNRLGDAHGSGRNKSKPAPRHAQLAVNLAGSMTSFLVATWESKKTK